MSWKSDTWPVKILPSMCKMQLHWITPQQTAITTTQHSGICPICKHSVKELASHLYQHTNTMNKKSKLFTHRFHPGEKKSNQSIPGTSYLDAFAISPDEDAYSQRNIKDRQNLCPICELEQDDLYRHLIYDHAYRYKCHTCKTELRTSTSAKAHQQTGCSLRICYS